MYSRERSSSNDWKIITQISRDRHILHQAVDSGLLRQTSPDVPRRSSGYEKYVPTGAIVFKIIFTDTKHTEVINLTPEDEIMQGFKCGVIEITDHDHTPILPESPHIISIK